MEMRRMGLLALGTIFSLVTGAVAENGMDEKWKKEIERRLDMLARQQGQSSTDLTGPGEGIYKGQRGFAPAASKVYHVPRGVSVGGYGEMIYNNFQNERDNGTASGRQDQIDFVRNIIYVGFKYNDRIIFNSEIEFEHASTTNGGTRGEVSVEFANLDFSLLFDDEQRTVLGIRTGLLLLPIGLRNELHEPTLFHGTARPSTERVIIPSTWRDNGFGIFGDLMGLFEYRAYLTAALQAVQDANGFGGFSSGGLRGGRTKGARSIAEDKALSARLDFKGIPGTLIGGSAYIAETGQDVLDANGNEIDGGVDIYEVHVEAEFRGVELTALYAAAEVDDVARLNAANGLTGNGSIGEELAGGYIELAFDVLSLCDTNQYLAPFYRYEKYDTQKGVPAGFTENPARDVVEHTFGVSYKPIPNVVVKFDVQNQNNNAATGVDSANIGIGFLY